MFPNLKFYPTKLDTQQIPLIWQAGTPCNWVSVTALQLVGMRGTRRQNWPVFSFVPVAETLDRVCTHRIGQIPVHDVGIPGRRYHWFIWCA